MIKVWTYGNVDLDEENLLIQNSAGMIDRQKEIAPVMMKNLNTEDLKFNNAIQPFRQRMNIRVSDYFIKALETLCTIVCDGNDYGLRNITFKIADEKLYLIGGTGEVVYKIDMSMDPDYDVEWNGNSFDFMIQFKYEDIKAFINFVSSAYDIGAIDIGASPDSPDKMFFIVYSDVKNNAVGASDNDDEDSDSSDGCMAMFKVTGSTERSPILSMLRTDEEINEYPVIYQSSIIPSTKSRFKIDQKYIELAQNRGILSLRTENTEKEITSVIYTGCSIVAKKGALTKNGEPFAAVDGKALLNVLEYKQPGKSNARNYDNYTLDVWFDCNEENGSIQGFSDLIRIYNNYLEVFIAQKLVKTTMPEQIEYVLPKKGKIVEASSEREALESALASAHINKKERLKMITDMNLEAEESIPDSIVPKPIEVDDNLENDFITRIQNLQNTMDELKTGIDKVNERLDTFENIVASLRGIAMEKLKNRMGGKKVVPVALPDLTSEGYLEVALKKYLSSYKTTSIDKNALINTIGSQHSDSLNADLVKMVELNVLYRYKENTNVYYIPEDFEDRYKNYKLGVKSGRIILNLNDNEVKQ